jgi:hypothetical protein
MRLSTRLMIALSMMLVAPGCGGGGDDGGEVAPDAAAAAPDAFVCSPGEFLGCVDSETAELCGPEGDGIAGEDCAFGCSADVGGCRACTPSATECHGDELVTCDASGGIAEARFCELGCADAACAILEPTNLPADVCESPAGEDFIIGAAQVRFIDTDTDPRCEVVAQGGSQSPQICMIRGDLVQIARGGSIRAGGSRALALVAHETLILDGVIDLSAAGPVPGPGTPTGNLGEGEGGGGGDETDPPNQGGGGGGHGGNGGDGSSFQQVGGGGGGGAAFGNAEISPLRGGAPGGGNGTAAADPRHAEGGGGGGALQLVACGERVISSGDGPFPSALIIGEHAFLNAGGGGGDGGGGSAAAISPGGGGGGGSGGAVLIEAPSVAVLGVVAANGGGGGGGGARGDGATEGAAGQAGADGLASAAQAAGGVGADGSDGGDGGSGQGAEPGATGANAGGGGGGAAGRIRINTRTDPLLSDGILSPSPSTGPAATR